MIVQYFKFSDLTERKFDDSFEPGLSALELQRDEFFDGAYEAAPLGDVIVEGNLAPLARAIPQAIFRLAFKQIFDAFVKVGTFEAYITVFQKIFGDDVDIEFTVPGPGKLNIDIVAQTLEISPFVARHIEDNAYVFDNVVDDVDDQIVFQGVLGFQSQYELEQMLFEMVPAGIFTNISLTLGA